MKPTKEKKVKEKTNWPTIIMLIIVLFWCIGTMSSTPKEEYTPPEVVKPNMSNSCSPTYPCKQGQRCEDHKCVIWKPELQDFDNSIK